MLNKPRLKTYLTVFPISDTTWGLRGGSEEIWRVNLSDERAIRAFGVLLPHLNGHSSVEDILHQSVEHGADREALEGLLQLLEESSFIEDADVSVLEASEVDLHRDQMAFFSRFSPSGGARQQVQLRDSKVALVGQGALSACVVRHLAASGLGEIVLLLDDAEVVKEETLPQGAKISVLPLDRNSISSRALEENPPQLFIVPQEAHEPALLEAMDSLSKKRQLPWLLLRALDPHEGWVGPLFIPGETASYASLEGRLRSNMRFHDEYLAFDRHVRNGGGPAPRCGGLHVFFEMLSAIAVAEVIKYLTGFSTPFLAGRFLTINLVNWETEVHEVLRLPHIEAASIDQPRVFSWKDIPYDGRTTRRG